MKKIDKEELHILFEGIKSNNNSAFDTLYEKYKVLVYGVSFTVCKNHDIADEVTQNVFFKIWRLPSEKLPTSSEASWLYMVAKNETLDILRKNNSDIDIDSIYNIENDNNDVLNIVDIDSYNRRISGLPEQEKQIISLKLLYDFTFKEIGELLGIPTATAQWKYYKSINSLKLAFANLAMFILTFALFLKNKLSSTNTNKKATDSTVPESTVSETVQDSIIHEDSFTNSKSGATTFGDVSISPDVTGSTSTSTYTKERADLSNQFLYVSSLFLVLTLVFTIIFKNYQQKLKNKTSKHYMKK